MIYVILLLALLLRIPLLDGSFWLDEAAQYLESARPLQQQLQIRDDFQPPLMHLLTFVGIRLGALFGLERAEWFIRLLPSLVPGLLSIYGLYLIGVALRKPKTGLLASFLLSISSLHVFYSQELRPYSLPTLWAVFSTWLLLRQHWVGFVILSIFGLYSSYLYPFFLGGQLLYLIYHKTPWSRLLAMGAAILAGFAPWLPKFFEQLAAGQALRSSMPGWEEVVSLPQFKTALLVPAKFIFGVLDLEFNLPFLVLGTIVLSGSAYLSWQFGRQLLVRAHSPQNTTKTTSTKQLAILILCCLIIPLVASWLVSFIVPVLQAKRVLLLLPFWYLLIAWLITHAWQRQRLISRVLLGSLLLIGCWSNLAYYRTPALQRENWRSLQQAINARFAPQNTILVFGFDAPFASWQYYDQGQFPDFSSGSFNTSTNAELAEQIKVIDRYSYVLLFDYLRDLTDAENRLEQLILDLGFREAGVLDYPVIGFVRVYAKTATAQLPDSIYENWD